MTYTPGISAALLERRAAEALPAALRVIAGNARGAEDLRGLLGVLGVLPPTAAPPSGIRHGTEAGAKTHYDRGEKPCADCRRAVAAAQEARRRFIKTHWLRRCRECGSVFVDAHACHMPGRRSDAR